jgi:hypothetical protein
MKTFRHLFSLIAAAACFAAFSLTTAFAQTVVLSDSFSRDPSATLVGNRPQFTAPSPGTWISSWGANNNNAGGYVTQTYTTYTDGTNPYKNDGGKYSGNYLNNGDPTTLLKLNNSTTTITEPIGLPGFAWVQINHDFAADSTVINAGKLRITFDLYRTPAGNISWFFGNGAQNGVNNGNSGSPVLNTANDIGLLWRGPGSASGNMSIKDSGAHPAGYGGTSAQSDSFAFVQGNAAINALTPPIPVQIDITGTAFGTSSSLVEMWVAGVQQDLNGTNPGLGLGFTWDGEASAYMGFGSNNSPIEGSLGSEVFRASGIDNLVITAVPEPTSAALLGLGALGLIWVARSRKR